MTAAQTRYYAISVIEPTASAIANGYKTIELRRGKGSPWSTHVGETIIIVASRRGQTDPDVRAYTHQLGMYGIHIPPADQRYGQAVCAATLAEVRPWRPADRAAACAVAYGQWALCLSNVVKLPPISITGHQGMYQLPDETARQIHNHLNQPA